MAHRSDKPRLSKMLNSPRSSFDDAEASGDGHQADEDVRVGGAERVEAGAQAAEPA